MTRLGTPGTARGLGPGLALALSLTACSSSSSTPAPHPAPTAAAACDDLGTRRGDGFVVAGSDWSGETRAYDEAATVYACASAGSGGTVRFEVTGSGITVTPPRRPLSAYPTGVVPFRVRVSPGASGRLVMLQEGPGLASGGPGPAVIAASDGWRFDRPD